MLRGGQRPEKAPCAPCCADIRRPRCTQQLTRLQPFVTKRSYEQENSLRRVDGSFQISFLLDALTRCKVR